MTEKPNRRNSTVSQTLLRASLPRSASLAALLAFAAGHAFAAPKRAAKASPTRAPKIAAEPAKPAPLLDTALVRRYYLDGDFDPAIDILESTLRDKTGLNHEDSVFIFKHLGVMYAAKYDTREKGKHYMLKLLEVEPTARILDMYASDMIYMIFKNIQDEFEAARRKHVRVDSMRVAGEPQHVPGKGSTPEPKPAKGGTGYVWLGATATMAVAAGVATYFYFSDEQKVRIEDHTPATNQ